MDKQKEITKVIIPVAGLGTRFLPLSKVLSKEFFPLADKPAIQYIVQEIKDSGIEEIIFIISHNQKSILNYFAAFLPSFLRITSLSYLIPFPL